MIGFHTSETDNGILPLKDRQNRKHRRSFADRKKPDGRTGFAVERALSAISPKSLGRRAPSEPTLECGKPHSRRAGSGSSPPPASSGRTRDFGKNAVTEKLTASPKRCLKEDS